MSHGPVRRAVLALVGLVLLIAWLAWEHGSTRAEEPGAHAPVAEPSRDESRARPPASPTASRHRSDQAATSPTLDDLRRDPSFRAGLASVVGRCVDPRGRPLAGVRVEVTAPERVLGGDDDARPHPFSFSSGAATTDAGGRFRIDGLAPGVTNHIEAHDGQHWVLHRNPAQALASTPASGTVDLVPGHVTDVGDLVLRAGATLRGRLCDERGHPVPSGSVRAVGTRRSWFQPLAQEWIVSVSDRAVDRTGDWQGHVLRAQTGDNGEFVLAGLEPGTWSLVA